MLISCKWLSEWIDTALSAEEMADALTSLGLEAAITSDTRGAFSGFVVGKVLSCEKHPDADKLSATMVDVGSGTPLSIVCGAANVAAGLTVPVATVGAEVPAAGLKIEKRKLRGVMSEGMICSESEIGLADESDGIMVLDSSLAAGTALADALEVEDVIIEVDLTPNRGDALSLLGIARELAAYTGKEIKLPEHKKTEEGRINSFTITVEDEEACPVYTACDISGVTVAQSPVKIRRRLQAAGIRPINNIVDITNYVMMETGHPMHAFDRRTLKRAKIIVRHATDGEKFTTLDEKEHELKKTDLVIADGESAVALAGIMGGLNSEIKDDTTDVVLEVACFNPLSTRVTARRLSISTDSSYRFERGINRETIHLAAHRATMLMQQLAGGAIGGLTDISTTPPEDAVVTLRTKKVNSTLGITLTNEDVADILARLHFCFDGCDGTFSVTVPPFRHDIEQELDLVEEVARLYGYHNIPSTTPRLSQHTSTHMGRYASRSQLANLFTAAGMMETVNYSFINKKWRQDFGINSGEAATLANPINADWAEMRTSLLPGLMNRTSFNIRHGEEAVSIFEIGAMFCKSGDGVEEKFLCSGILTGGQENIFGTSLPRDFFRLKGILENSLLRASGIKPEFIKIDEKRSYLYNHRQAEITVNGSKIGFMGQVHINSEEPFNIGCPVYCFEFAIEPLLESGVSKIKIKDIPKLPGLKRDIAVTLDERKEIGGVIETILATDKRIVSAKLFDLYQGKQVQDGKKSAAFRLLFQVAGQTLTDEDGDSIISAILKRLEEEHDASLRS